MMNIECDNDTLTELEGVFRFNDAVLRHLTIRKQDAVTEQSEMLKVKEEKDRSSRDSGDRRRPSRDAAPVAAAKETETAKEPEAAKETPAEPEATKEVAAESKPAEAPAEPVAAEESETKPEAGE